MWQVLNWKHLGVLAAILLSASQSTPAQAQLIPWAYNSIFGPGPGYYGWGWGAPAYYGGGYNYTVGYGSGGYGVPVTSYYGYSAANCGCNSCGCNSCGCAAGGCASCGYVSDGCANCGYVGSDCGCGVAGCANCAGCAAGGVQNPPPVNNNNNNNVNPTPTYDKPNPNVGDDFNRARPDEVRPNVNPGGVVPRNDGFSDPLRNNDGEVLPNLQNNTPGAKAVPLDALGEILASVKVERQRMDSRLVPPAPELARIEVPVHALPLADVGEMQLVRR